MGLSTRKVARLVFTTAGGGTFTITLPDPREDVQVTEIVAAMESLIASDIYMTAVGALTGIKDAKIVDTTINDLFDPAAG
ncbi:MULTISPECIES: DUF2922 domain-containing protein [Desulfitobacterium]|uniref:DUF2922 domain-containing protein n=1 Tax=Desulfitobacterium dehalogenans (strain ATCC 51507 / DSM 9161 / JW/IU-DC1) TaxID=756499 RepID=I4A8J3_DESDJ|nr:MULTISPECIES: DUF2922 domain-containing protein [Desulfitobacterium]AFM00278.1 Protein of unknown function (DUF2922) [Desulfitobacterium dehalogenans ATCC 51507]